MLPESGFKTGRESARAIVNPKKGGMETRETLLSSPSKGIDMLLFWGGKKKFGDKDT